MDAAPAAVQDGQAHSTLKARGTQTLRVAGALYARDGINAEIHFEIQPGIPIIRTSYRFG